MHVAKSWLENKIGVHLDVPAKLVADELIVKFNTFYRKNHFKKSKWPSL